MDLFTGMESAYGYSDEQQGGYYEECYSPDQGGSYYDPDCFDYSYDAHDYYANENSGTCACMEEKPRSKWEELLEICITEVQKNRKHRSGTTYQPPQATYLGRGRKERKQEPTELTPAADQTQRRATHFHIGPPEVPQPAELDSDTDAGPSPAAAAPLRSRPPPEQHSPDPQSPSTATIPESITFNIYDALKFHRKEGAEGYQECNVIQVVTDCVGEVKVTYHQTQDPLESCLINSFTPTTDLSTCEANVCARIAELESNWTSPYMIKKIYDSGTVELLALDGTLFQANGHRVKMYYSSDKVMEEEVALEEPPKE
ncbi:hypothetical protein SASPL_143874 [Salvia splendens]|uniref:Uncharacterized protein n=1 Tax=Salvia splendens TaxID=180675 RepID=A0A8X8WPI0_SALSN|nr:hypothetical protein SASPL_143874 [Salvia splendens]